MIALFVASCSKLQVCKITRETTQNAYFEQRGPTLYTKLLVLFLVYNGFLWAKYQHAWFP